MRILLITTLLLFLTSCGVKGNLYLPKEKNATTVDKDTNS